MIYIVGSGWYGLFISEILDEYKISYEIHEKSSHIFSGASGFNQNRLHMGYHYPRDKFTREICYEGYKIFNEKFEDLTNPIKNNIYAIHNESVIDSGTYESIYSNENLPLKKFAGNKELLNCQNYYITDEKFIDPIKSIMYWEKKEKKIIFNSFVNLDNGKFKIGGRKLSNKDLIIDCTWGELLGHKNFYTENFLTFVIKPLEKFFFGALTIMDGPFFSIFPYSMEENLFTVTHVKYGKISNKKKLTKKEVNDNWNLVLLEIDQVLPEFKKNVQYIDYFVSRKFKPISASDSRKLEVNYLSDKAISIHSGKIDSIFFVKRYIKQFLKKNKMI